MNFLLVCSNQSLGGANISGDGIAILLCKMQQSDGKISPSGRVVGQIGSNVLNIN
ncbi:hypothetical protein ACR78Z_18010 [Sphingobacterium thalpophilum]|uniref:Uncharacterized protein n=1 Tax=Sphingobacterium thalpophilum TaxID=259 RepID=A0ABV4H8J3_9SPHI|nr:hypothetical protein [Sphingobacterium thalpophilum]